MSQFIYPYNFVSIGDSKKREKFKPLHYYDGLTGRIEYTLENLSPLFIPDPEGTTIYKVEDGEHKAMDFFNINEHLCIPPTSIKGMVRSVVEAATNSTFGVLDRIEKKFSFRKKDEFRNLIGIYRDNKIVPCKVAKLPLGALKEAIKSLKNLSSINLVDEDKINEYRNKPIEVKLWKIHTGRKVVMSFKLGGQEFTAIALPINIKEDEGRFELRNKHKRQIVIENGEKFYCPWDDEVFNCESFNVGRNFTADKVNFKYCNFPKLNYGHKRVIEITHNGKIWTGISNDFVEGKFFLQKFYEDKKVRESDIKKSELYTFVTYGEDESNAYSVSTKDYIDIYGQLENGQVVYYEKKDGESIDDKSILEFGPVSMFKSAENASLKEILPKQIINSKLDEKHLCSASRLFGWTPEKDENNKQGISGRVRFKVACTANKVIEDMDIKSIPLKILASPKPQYYPFYLKAKNGTAGAAYYTQNIDTPWSNTPGVIRGRKFYLHHPDPTPVNWEAYLSLISEKLSDDAGKNIIKDKNGNDVEIFPHTKFNSTCKVLFKKTKFKGAIEFESLDTYELGMLLWCLTLSENPVESSEKHAHKLGMGKGIGMGSVRFNIDKVLVENPEKNWFQKLDDENVDLEHIDKEVIKDKKLSGYVKEFLADTSNSTNIKDLLRVLQINLVKKNPLLDIPIQYYSPDDTADKGYGYFMREREKRKNNHEEDTLKTLEEIEKKETQNG
ncbi:TIGR03986 family CRISPR-associated RAMP protein [Candidatus Desantisbacteria bacterium]|nr:TIGR03986 family CRISPR-associated RAMP protein [Candidatus Desantisbacteria bacterium]